LEIVIDTNVLISALIKPSKTRELILSSKLILHSPEHIINETLNNKKEILQKSGLDDAEFQKLTSVLLTRINLVPVDDFKNSIKEALKLVTHPEDSPFIALALSKNIALWSEDKDLKSQAIVKVYSTKEISEKII